MTTMEIYWIMNQNCWYTTVDGASEKYVYSLYTFIYVSRSLFVQLEIFQ